MLMEVSSNIAVLCYKYHGELLNEHKHPVSRSSGDDLPLSS